MISHKAKVSDHRPKTLPSRERRGFDDEASKTAGCLDVRVHRLREFHKVVLLERRLWLHVQDGMLFIEVVFDHVSLLQDCCGPRAELAEGVDAQGDGYPCNAPPHCAGSRSTDRALGPLRGSLSARVWRP